MNVDWRYLLGQARIPFVDRGRNTARGRVNIKCPWCFDDPSQHLSIEEASGLFYCMRDNRHKGVGATRILEAHGMRRVEAVAMEDEARLDQPTSLLARKALPTGAAMHYKRFASIIESKRHLDYLRSRGFTDPLWAAVDFDLRFTVGGAHSNRVLIPLYNKEGMTGWTGRALVNDHPKPYLMHTSDGKGSVAGRIRPHTESLLVVEGPMDALKLNYALTATKYTAIAILGKALTAERIQLIKDRRADEILVCLDNDSSLAETMLMLNELTVNCRGSTVRRAQVPRSFKDPGSMSVEAITQWRSTL